MVHLLKELSVLIVCLLIQRVDLVWFNILVQVLIGTFPHGLGKQHLNGTIFKCLNVNTTDWDCYHVGIGNSRVLKLDQDVVQSAEGVAYYNRTDPTDTLFTLGLGGENNTLNRDD